jgi:uncharacterized protein involved in exopolysaccharide biosynthesis
MNATAQDDELEPVGPGKLTLLRPVLLASLLRFRWLLVAGLVAGVCFGLFRGLVTANQFRSLGKLYVRPGVREAMSPDAVLSGGALVPRTGGSREAVQNVLQALTAPEYYELAVAKLGADVVMAPYDPANDADAAGFSKRLFHAFQSWWFGGGDPAGGGALPQVAANVLQNSLVMFPEANASVVTFVYTSHTPELAKRVVDGALEAAIEWHRQVFEKLSSQEQLEAELAVARRDLAAAEERLRAFRNQRGVSDYKTEHERLVAYIAELDRLVDKLDIEARSLESALVAQSEHLAKLAPTRASSGSRTWVDSPEYMSLMQSRAKLRDDLLASERGEGSGEEKRARRARFEEQIKEIDGRLAKTEPKLQTPPIEEENPVYVRTCEHIADLQVSLRAKQTERDRTGDARAVNRKRLDELESMAAELRALEEEHSQKRTFVDGLAASVSNLRAVQRLEQVNLSNVGVMHLGTMDGVKIAPRRGMLLGMGAFGGLAAAIGLVALLGLLDRRVRLREELTLLGVPDEGAVVSGDGGSGMPWMLPSTLAEIRDDIARFWARLPYERRKTEGLRIGFVPCGEGASAGRAAAALAVGLAAHGGEKVCFVGTLEGPSWLGQRLGLDHQCGWSEVLRGEFPLADAVVATPVHGLSYLPAGRVGPVVPHPMAGPQFAALLDRLAATHRFVVVELPDVSLRPEGRAVLGVLDGAHVVVQRKVGAKAAVRDAIEAVRTAGARLLGGVLQ